MDTAVDTRPFIQVLRKRCGRPTEPPKELVDAVIGESQEAQTLVENLPYFEGQGTVLSAIEHSRKLLQGEPL